MIVFWILAALLSGLAAVLVLARAARAERRAPTADPVMDVYRRQLGEIEDLGERGLLGPEELRAARAETGRRLLAEADAARGAPAAAAPPQRMRRIVMAAAVAAPLLAFGGYLVLGRPGFPDQPYQARLKRWKAEDPSRLTPPQMAAVLQALAEAHPNDPRPLIFLGQVDAAVSDLPDAQRAFRKALQLDPRSAAAWSGLGEVLVQAAKGDITAEAQDAFERALAIEPTALAPRYFLARAKIAAGQVQAGLDGWRAIQAGMAADDPRRQALAAEIAEVEKTGALAVVQPAGAAGAEAGPPAGAQESAFIQSMVARLAARLKAQPDDPAGWARLIRAYGVLGDKARQDAAIAEAKRLFKDRPAELKTALASAPGAGP